MMEDLHEMRCMRCGKNFYGNHHCTAPVVERTCKTCIDGPCSTGSIQCVNCGTGLRNWYAKTPPQTNGDRIRGMNDEQLAELIDKTGCGLCGLLGIRDLCRASKNKSCYEIIMAWLNQPAKGV